MAALQCIAAPVCAHSVDALPVIGVVEDAVKQMPHLRDLGCMQALMHVVDNVHAPISRRISETVRDGDTRSQGHVK